jgi:hypothetical protein
VHPHPPFSESTHKIQVLRSGWSSVTVCNNSGTLHFHSADLRIRCTLGDPGITSTSLEDSFGDRVNCCNGIAEMSSLVDVRGLPYRCLHIIPVSYVSNLSRILVTVWKRSRLSSKFSGRLSFSCSPLSTVPRSFWTPALNSLSADADLCNGLVYWAGWSGFRVLAVAGVFYSPPCPDRLWDLPSLISIAHQRIFPWG